MSKDEHLRGFPMLPAWDRDQRDPNWSAGAYHGMRMRAANGQAAYGFHRATHEHDLLGYGGFHGVYDEGTGRYGADGAFHHPSLEARDPRARKRLAAATPPEMAGRVEDGGVRADNRYLAQYNVASQELHDRPEGRGYGHAPAGGRDGALAEPGIRERTDERGYAGYNRSGFAGGRTLDPRK